MYEAFVTEQGHLLDHYGNDVDARLLGLSHNRQRALVELAECVAVFCVDGWRLCAPRWECSVAHREAFGELYARRFPGEW